MYETTHRLPVRGALLRNGVSMRSARRRSLSVRGALLRTALAAALLGAGATDGQTQEPEAPPAARPEDVASPDAIIGALYDVISGPSGQARDWDRFRSLFVPGARLIPTGWRPDGTVAFRVMSPEEYIAASARALEERGFFEREISRTTEQFGAILHAFSSYETRHAADEAEPFARGINSIQLLNDGARWWVVTVFWESEGPERPIPPRYLQEN